MAGQPITLALPTVGEAGPGYATKLLTAIAALETELERKVVPVDMDMNANLSFLSGVTNYGVTGLKYTQYALQSEASISAASFPMALFAGSSDGELYYNDNFGRQIAITSNGAVNVSTSGGITGAGYGASDVEVRWDAGDGEYEFRIGAGADDYADLRCDDVVLNDGSSHFLRVTATSMAADYTLTLPSAVPATNNTVLAMSTAGAVTATATPTVTSLTTTGAATVGTNLAVTGDITVGDDVIVTDDLVVSGNGAFGEDVTLSADKNLVLQGTGKVVHGDRTLCVPGVAFKIHSGAVTLGTHYEYDFDYVKSLGATNFSVAYGLQLPVGTRITNIQWLGSHGGTGDDLVCYVRRTNITTGTGATVETETVTSAGSFDVSTTTDFTWPADNVYTLICDLTQQNDLLRGVIITYHTPA